MSEQQRQPDGPFGDFATACQKFWAPVFGGLKNTADVAVEIADSITTGVSGDIDGTVSGLFQRATAWGHSLSRLATVADFQAHAAGSRALFETALDLELLTQKHLPVEQMLAWERSARFQNAERAIKSARRRNVADGPIERAAKDFIANNQKIVSEDRARFWRKNHKQRWTGNTLFDDGETTAARGAFQPAVVMRDHYERLCWSTHGSGLVIERALPADRYPGLVLLAAHLSGSMITHSARCCLEHFGKWSDEWNSRLQLARMGMTTDNMRAATEPAKRTESL